MHQKWKLLMALGLGFFLTRYLGLRLALNQFQNQRLRCRCGVFYLVGQMAGLFTFRTLGGKDFEAKRFPQMNPRLVRK